MKRNIKKTLIVILMSNIVMVEASAQNSVPSTHQANGYREYIGHRYLMKPSEKVREFSREPLTSDQKEIAEQALQLSRNNSLLSLLLIERGKIVYEHYNWPAKAENWFYSWSMSKSLTAYTLGTALCKGRINSLEEQAGKISPELSGTAQGESRVKDLLMMASGARDAMIDGEYKSSAWMQIVSQAESGQEYLRANGERAKGIFGDRKSGSTFNYKNTDTLALESVIEAKGGFTRQFEEEIWNEIGAEGSSSWVLDKAGRAVSYAGFTANTRDWARLAMWTIDKIKGSDICIRDYMKEATKHQISTNSNTFRSYGYQTWIGNFGPRSSYWWAGHAGQRVGVDPESERIIVVSSWRSDYMDQVENLFGKWQRYKIAK